MEGSLKIEKEDLIFNRPSVLLLTDTNRKESFIFEKSKR